MSMKGQIENLEASCERLRREMTSLQEKYRQVKEELDHYRAAVAGVKWLWERAGQQPPFQL